MGHQIYVVLRDLSTIENILKNSTPKVSRMLCPLYPLLGNGILINQRMDWWRSRRILHPMFSCEALQAYMQVFNKSADNLMELWSGYHPMRLVKLGDYMKKFSLEVLVNCIFHRRQRIQRRPEPPVLKYIGKMAEIQDALIERQFNPMHQFDTIYYRSSKGKKFLKDVEEANEFVSSLINESYLFKEGKLMTSDIDKDRNTLMEMLMQATDKKGNKLTGTELRDEVSSILFAGLEPLSASLQYILYCLATNQDHQETCRNEILSVMHDRTEIEWSDLTKFRFLAQCIHESLRLFQPIGALCRQMNNSTVIEGHWVPPGTKVIINLWQMHEDPASWPEPLKFNPHRFKDENVAKRTTSYAPFSAGYRECIGQKFAISAMKLLLGRILMYYRVKIAANFEMNRVNRYFIVPQQEVQIKIKRA